MTAIRSERWPTTLRSCAMKRSVSPNSPCKVAEQVQDLCADRDVERGDGLVRDNELRTRDQRTAIPIPALGDRVTAAA